MESLRWVDQTYVKKHKSEDPSHLRAMYYPNLIMYPVTASTASADQKKSPMDAMIATLYRYGRKAAISVVVLALSYIPYVGRFVLPAVSFYTFNNAVGLEPALVVFGGGIFLPRRYLVMFLQSYFASRSLMRDLVCRRPLLASNRANRHSLTPTSNGSNSPKSRSAPGSETVKESCSALALAFSSFSRFHYSEY